VAVVKGLLTPFLGEVVNYVNAERMAEARGIELVSAVHSGAADYPHLVAVTLTTGGGEPVEVAGTLFGERDPRIVRVAGFPLEFRPAGCLLMLRNVDVPGFVGRLGTLLGQAGVNIADIHLARRDGGGAPGEREALAVLRLDERLPEGVLDRLRQLPEMREARVLDVGPGVGSGLGNGAGNVAAAGAVV
jgi:D-3-phosphoglycerate dehydrogenase